MPLGLRRDADRARNQTPGGLVLLRAARLPEPLPGLSPEAEVVCLNAVRRGKDFLNHYLVPLDPLPGRRDELTLLYVDFDLPLKDCGAAFSLTLTLTSAPPASTAPVCGQVVENPHGRFLKVREAYKGAFSLAYVDLATGAVRRRQEVGMTGLYDWTLTPTGKDPRQGLVARLRHLTGG